MSTRVAGTIGDLLHALPSFLRDAIGHRAAPAEADHAHLAVEQLGRVEVRPVVLEVYDVGAGATFQRHRELGLEVVHGHVLDDQLHVVGGEEPDLPGVAGQGDAGECQRQDLPDC